MAGQAIRELIQAIIGDEAEADRVYRALTKTRNHLAHGRSPDSVASKSGIPLGEAVNMAAALAWRAIGSLMPIGEAAFCHRGGDFVRRRLQVSPEMIFDQQGEGEYPPESMIPEVGITLKARFERRDEPPAA